MARYTGRSSSRGARTLTMRLPTGRKAQALDRFPIRRRAEALASADTRTLKPALYSKTDTRTLKHALYGETQIASAYADCLVGT